MEAVERQEIYCHNCGQYVQFPVDLSLDGNHVLKCPNCGHEHCRVVKAGRITEDRWDAHNGPTITITSGVTVTATSVYYTCTGTTTSSIDLWVNYGSWASS